MPKYTVSLSRAYLVDIEAEDREEAARLVEFYLGNCPDLSTDKDREEHHFRITAIESAVNDAFEVVEGY
ncbi:hypothetical protein KJ564_07830 [bacterium]|nr:hypothetical protein [bacterium]